MVPPQKLEGIRDLGATISSSLSWNRHVDSTVSEVTRISGLIKRTLG